MAGWTLGHTANHFSKCFSSHSLVPVLQESIWIGSEFSKSLTAGFFKLSTSSFDLLFSAHSFLQAGQRNQNSTSTFPLQTSSGKHWCSALTSPNPTWPYPYKKGNLDTDVCAGGTLCVGEGVARVMLLQAKKHQRLGAKDQTQGERRDTAVFHTALRRKQPWQVIELSLPASRPVRPCIFVVEAIEFLSFG